MWSLAPPIYIRKESRAHRQPAELVAGHPSAVAPIPRATRATFRPLPTEFRQRCSQIDLLSKDSTARQRGRSCVFQRDCAPKLRVGIVRPARPTLNHDLNSQIRGAMPPGDQLMKPRPPPRGEGPPFGNLSGWRQGLETHRRVHVTMAPCVSEAGCVCIAADSSCRTVAAIAASAGEPVTGQLPQRNAATDVNRQVDPGTNDVANGPEGDLTGSPACVSGSVACANTLDLGREGLGSFGSTRVSVARVSLKCCRA